MQPQQARLTFAIFLVLSAYIVFNALYLQSDAGFVRPLTTDKAVTKDTLPARYFSPAGQQKASANELLRAVRRELSQRNYFPGNFGSRLDERVDAMTMGAVMAYQYDHGLPVSGLVTEDLLKSFLFGVENTTRQRSAPPEMSAGTHQLVAEVQGILSAKGYYDGKIDGVFKSRSMAAVKRFESARGLPVTGRISGLLVQELSRSTGVEFNASQK